MKPAVSVVIPAFNHARFVSETIESVLGQSFADFEIVITDDGSSDGTADVIRRFDDPRINLEVFPENQGAVVALNSAIGRARGEFICFLASDDRFLPGKLEQQVAFLQENPGISAVFGMPQFIDENGGPLESSQQFNGEVFETPFRKNITSKEAWLRQFFFAGNCLCHPSAMVRRAVYDEIGLFDPRLANLPDFDMWVRLSMRHEIAVLREPLTAMRIHSDNRNMSAPRRDTLRRAHFETFEILKRYKRLPLESLRRVFAEDIAQNGLAGIDRPEILLAELALTSSWPIHALFALDLLFGNISASEDSARKRLIELAGSRDIFGVDIAARLEGAEAAGRSHQADYDAATGAFAREQALRRQSDAARLELEKAIRHAASEVEGLQRSRTFALVKIQKSFRRRIERLAAALRLGSPHGES
jgi:glycosyltransferase involved in cell wall biosynthesis